MPSRFRITPDRAVLIGLLLTAAVYCQDLRYDFILDDLPLILLNTTISSWHNWKILFLTHIFYLKEGGVPVASLHYRPVFGLWLMLNRQVFGPILPWWHLTSLLLHLGVSVLVYKLSLELFEERWTAALAALVFAFHPIHAEPVAYVSASGDLLATFFILIALLGYIRFRKQGLVGYLVTSVFAAALAMLSKETAAVLPWALLAYELLGENQSLSNRSWSRFIWTLPYFGIVIAYSVIRTALFGHNLWPGSNGSHLIAILNIPLVLIVYFRNLLAPFELSFCYPLEWISNWDFLRTCGFILLIAGTILLWRRDKYQNTVRLQIFWLAIFLVPTVMAIFVFVSEGAVHDRHLYLASIPFFLIFANLTTDVSPKLVLTGSSLILAIFLVVTALQVPTFRDEITLCERAVRVAPNNVLGRGYYASALWNYGRHDEAFEQFRRIIELAPQSPFGYEDYAAALAETGHDEQAAYQYQEALERTSGSSRFRGSILYHLGMIQLKQNQVSQSVEHLRAAVQIDPENPSYHLGLGEALREEGHTNEAMGELRLQADLRKRQLEQPIAR